MKIVQSLAAREAIGSILRVDSDIFAELLSKSGDNYHFSLRFSVGLNDKRKNPKEYSRVVVTVKKRDGALLDASNSMNVMNVVQVPSVGTKPNAIKNFSKIAELRPNNDTPVPVLPSLVQNKLYSGLQVLKDLNQKEEYIDQKEVIISNSIEESIGTKYSCIELFSSGIKTDQRLNREIFEKQTERPLSNLQYERLPATITDGSRIDPSDLIERINLELIDPTESIQEEETKQLNTRSYLNTPSIKKSLIKQGKSQFHADVVKYFIDDVAENPIEDTLQLYKTRRVIKSLNETELEAHVLIPGYCKNSNLQVRFDLFEKDTNVIDETVTVDLFMPTHVEAYESVKQYPEVKVTRETSVFRSSHSRMNRYSIRIHDKEVIGKVTGFNVYMKSITQTGNVTPYQKIGYVENTGNNTLSVTTRTDLSVLRVIPVGEDNKESHVYTNLILGPGYDAIGALTIIPSHFGRGGSVKIEVFNIPKDTVSLSLYSRDCTENIDSKFFVSDTIKNIPGTSASFTDRKRQGRVYEYYVVACAVREGREKAFISNYVMFRNNPGVVENKSINVQLGTPSFNISTSGTGEVSFLITTTVSRTENERITESLKSQLGELYEQFLNPVSNASSPLGENRGVPQYSDLFFHEVVRTNLNTGEREVFDLITDGNFVDNQVSQKRMNINPIVPFYSYHYQVFTYKKNPIEIFKRYIAKGIDKKGKEWFYLPYKWLNPKAKSGWLYPDDAEGVPVIDAYESFTSESYGLTASHRVEGSAQFTSLTQIVADRIDRNTVKISWQLTGASNYNYNNLYDSFVVMKVVNGTRSFVGRCHRQFIYHELKESDLGTIYYIIVPIMSEFDIDKPGYSNSIFVGPDGIVPKVKATVISSTPGRELLGSQRIDVNQSKLSSLESSVQEIRERRS